MNPRALVVEDDLAVRMGCQEALELAGLHVDSYELAERMRHRLDLIGRCADCA